MEFTARGIRLEERSGGHFKFYVAIQAGNYAVFHWGRIGTSGQASITHYADVDSAYEAVARKVGTKASKGYEPEPDAAGQSWTTFTVTDDDVEWAAAKRDPKRISVLFARARTSHSPVASDNVAAVYREFTTQASRILRTEGDFTSMLAEWEGLKETWEQIEKGHAEAVAAMEMTNRKVGQAIMRGSLT